MQLFNLCSHSVLPHTARPCQLQHATQLHCVFTHSCSSHSRADIHNTRWSSVFAPLWTRCWCPRLSGRTWGPPWWPRPPPGTWAVWAEGWCPKAFWGSRRATCASRCKKREQEEEEGLAALKKTKWDHLDKEKGIACEPCMCLDETRVLLGYTRRVSAVCPTETSVRGPCSASLVQYRNHHPSLALRRHNNSVRDTKPEWLLLQLLYTMPCVTPSIGL